MSDFSQPSDTESDVSLGDRPTGSEALLLSTLPASARALCVNLMPRHRERILEITKTVTVTEIVTNSADCHPRACEVTVTNVESGSSHPVSVTIHHSMEKLLEEDEGSASRIEVRERFPEEGRKEIVNCGGEIESITTTTESYQKSTVTSGAVFDRSSDNIVDLQFTHRLDPLRSQPHIVHIVRGDVPPTVLQYAFSNPPKVPEGLLSPTDSAIHDSPKRSSQTSESESDDGSMVIHSSPDQSQTGRADSGVSSNENTRRKKLSTSSEDSLDDLQFARRPVTTSNKSSGNQHRYIVTSLSESQHPSHTTPNTTTLYAELDEPSGSKCQGDVIEGSAVTSVRMNDEKTTHEGNGEGDIQYHLIEKTDEGREERRIEEQPDAEVIITKEDHRHAANVEDETDRIGAEEESRECQKEPQPHALITSHAHRVDHAYVSRLHNVPTTHLEHQSSLDAAFDEVVVPQEVHITVDITGPIRGPVCESAIVGVVGDDVVVDVMLTPPTPSPRIKKSRTEEKRVEMEKEAPPPKPPRKTTYGWKIEEVPQQYVTSLDDLLKEPPKMTSTPLTSPERTARKSSSTTSLTTTSITTVPSRKSSKPTSLPTISLTHEEIGLTPSSPRRSPSSPIIVVNQDRSRKGSVELLDTPKAPPRRKSTVTDIDWFAAFQMKEPTTPKSPRSPLPIDALREVENAVIERRPRHQYRRGSAPLSAPLAPSRIDMDDVFACENLQKNSGEKCQCNACRITNMNEKERQHALERRRKAESRRFTFSEERREEADVHSSVHNPIVISIDEVFSPVTSPKGTPRQMNEMTNKLPAADISVEDIFAQPEQKKQSVPSDRFAKYEQHLKERQHKTAEATNHIITPEIAETRRKSSLPDADVSIDDIFSPPTASIDDVQNDDEHIRETIKTPQSTTHPAATRKLEERDDSMNDVFRGLSNQGHSVAPSIYISELDSDCVGPSPAFVAAPVENLRKSSLPDADISLDDVFNASIPSINRSTEHDTSRFEQHLREREQEKQNIQPAVTLVAAPVENLRKSSLPDADISLDDVFNASVPSINRSTEHDTSRFEQHLREREQEKQNIQPAVTLVAAPVENLRKSSLPDADISLDDVFNASVPSINRSTEHDTSRFEQHLREREQEKQNIQPAVTLVAAPVENLRKSSLPDADISLDDVFNASIPSINRSTEHDTSRFEQHLREREQEKQNIQPAVTLVAAPVENLRKSSLPDADISLDDVFNASVPSINRSTEHDTSRFEQHLREREQEKQNIQPAVTLVAAPVENLRKSSLPDADISLNDVFNASIPSINRSTEHDTSRFEQHLREREQEKQNIQPAVTLVAAPVENLRKSSLPDADISLDDVFNASIPSINRSIEHDTSRFEQHLREREQEKQNIQPAVTLVAAPVENLRKSSLPDADISLDDVFNASIPSINRSTEHDTSRFEQHLREREQEKQNIQPAVTLVAAPVENLRKSSLPDADISLDDVFNASIPSINRSTEHDTSRFEQHLREREQEKQNIQPAVTLVAAPVENLRKSSLPDADISLDDVFNASVPSINRSTEHDTSRFEQHLREREQEKQNIQPAVTLVAAPVENLRKSSLPDADISMNDVFNASIPSINRSTEHDTSRFEQHLREREQEKQNIQPAVTLVAAPVENLRKSSLPDADISLDDVFNASVPSINRSTEHDTSRFEQHLREREQEKQNIQPAVTLVAAPVENLRKSSLPDADISLDDVFNASIPSINRSIEHDTSRFEQHLREREQEKQNIQPAVTLVAAPVENLRKSSLPDADISLDDVFNASIPSINRSTEHDTSRFEQHLREREQEKQNIQPAVTLVAAPVENLRKSSLPDADIILDDVFNASVPITNRSTEHDTSRFEQHLREREQEKQNIQPAVTLVAAPVENLRKSSLPDADISLDDVFNASVPSINRSTEHNTSRFEQHLRERAQEKQNIQPAVTLVAAPVENLRKSSLPDADISLDDVFNASVPSINRSTEHDTSRFEQHLREREQEKKNIQPAVTLVAAPVENLRKSSLPDADISLDDVFNASVPSINRSTEHNTSRFEQHLREREQEKQNIQPAVTLVAAPVENLRKSSLPDADIILDDVFNASVPITNRSTEHDTSRFEQHLREREQEKQNIQPAVTLAAAPVENLRKSSLPDADISLDDVFNASVSSTNRSTEHDTSRFEQHLRERAQEKQNIQPAVTLVAAPVENLRKSSLPDADISLDDVFNASVPSINRSTEHNTSRFEQHLREREQEKQNIQPAVTLVAAPVENLRKSSLPDADIILDDVFNASVPITNRSTEHDTSRFEQHLREREQEKQNIQPAVTLAAAPVENLRKSSLPDADISLDDVFNASVSSTNRSTEHDTSRFEQHLRERAQEKQNIQPAVTLVAAPVENLRKSSLPDADISLDDVFNASVSSTNRSTEHDTSRFEQHLREREQEKQNIQPAVTLAAAPVENLRKSSLPDADISLDDVFNASVSSTNRSTEHDTSRFEQHLRERAQEKQNIQPAVTLAAAPVENLRKSSLPDADISLDYVFNASVSSTNRSTEHDTSRFEQHLSERAQEKQNIQPAVTLVAAPVENLRKSSLPDADISLDDVFNASVPSINRSTEHDTSRFEQHLREREQEKQNIQPAVTLVAAPVENLRKSSLPDADISLDDVFSGRGIQCATTSIAVEYEFVTPPYSVSECERIFDENGTPEPNDREWIQSVLSSSQQNQRKHTVSEVSHHDENILYRVFCSNGGHIEKEECQCSACSLTKLSDEDLRTLRRKWETTRERRISNHDETSVPPCVIVSDDITVDDIFEETKNEDSRRHLRETSQDDFYSSSSFDYTTRSDLPFSSNENSLYEVHGSEVSLDNVFVVIPREDQQTAMDLSSESASNHTNVSSATLRLEDPADITMEDIVKTTPPLEEHVPLDEIFLRESSSKVIDSTEDSMEQLYYQSRDPPPISPIKKTQRHHLNDFYDEPEEYDGELDVRGLVDDILSSSLDEAAFSMISRQHRLPRTPDKFYMTDTSVDRKRSEALDASWRVENKGNVTSKTAELSYFSNIASDGLMESVFSYPSSATANTTVQDRTITTNISDFVVTSAPIINRNQSPRTKETYVSSATVVMDSTEDDDTILRLVFCEQPKAVEYKTSPRVQQSIKVAEEVETSTCNYQETTTTTITTQTSQMVEKMTEQGRGDEEILEIEVNPHHFVIKGSYSMVISKSDPLGEMLSHLKSDGGPAGGLDFTVTPKLRRLLMQCLKDKADGRGSELSSRSRHILSQNNPADSIFDDMMLNPFRIENTTGNINFCTAENNVCESLLMEKFDIEPAIFQPDRDHLVHYAPCGGHASVKESLRSYLQDVMNASTELDELSLSPSGNASYDLICHCLFEQHDVLLTSTPTYSRNYVNVNERSLCRLEGVEMDLSNPRLNIADYQKRLQGLTAKGEIVRGVVLINPHNPSGLAFPKHDVIALCNWASSQNLWVLIDELFPRCEFGAPFPSFLTYRKELSEPTKVAWFWSLSKDFGLPGLKLCVIHTENRPLHEALCRLEKIHPVSSLAQDFSVNLIKDREWVHEFHRKKNNRLRSHYKFLTENLKHLEIPFVEAIAGIFIMADFSKKLSAASFEAENSLFIALCGRGVFLTPGSHQGCSVPGWFRVVFACQKEALEEGMRRLAEFFNGSRDVIGSIEYE